MDIAQAELPEKLLEKAFAHTICPNQGSCTYAEWSLMCMNDLLFALGANQLLAGYFRTENTPRGATQLQGSSHCAAAQALLALQLLNTVQQTL
jgi:hypothetical protein